MSAVLSADGTYRYALWRDLGKRLDDTPDATVLFVMLNPSTADAEQDDPTIRRCKDFAQRWGFSRLAVGNLFAFRATDPRMLADLGHKAVGPENDDWLSRLAKESNLIVAAWGAHKEAKPREEGVSVLCEFRPMRCLGRTAGGSPRHPLYVPKIQELEVWP